MPSLRITSCRSLFKRCVVLLLPSILVLLYLLLAEKLSPQTSNSVYTRSDSSSLSQSNSLSHWYSSPSRQYKFTENDINKLHTPFSTANNGEDVMVFLHMQKTGGTFFGKNLVKNLQLDTPCSCAKGGGMLKCPCTSADGSRYWLFSRYSTGWKCGLHADYTELTECLLSGKLDELEGRKRHRRYHYVSVLRDPSERYVSEWLHVSRGASWIDSTHRCNGRSPTKEEMPPCFVGESWMNVTIEEFIACPHNLARNRQTRMLANLSLIDCYSADMLYNVDKSRLLLDSAKHTLRSLPYFSIKSLLNESQLLFQETFDLKLRVPMSQQKNRHNKNSADVLSSLPPHIQNYNLSSKPFRKSRVLQPVINISTNSFGGFGTQSNSNPPGFNYSV